MRPEVDHVRCLIRVPRQGFTWPPICGRCAQLTGATDPVVALPGNWFRRLEQGRKPFDLVLTAIPICPDCARRTRWWSRTGWAIVVLAVAGSVIAMRVQWLWLGLSLPMLLLGLAWAVRLAPRMRRFPRVIDADRDTLTFAVNYPPYLAAFEAGLGGEWPNDRPQE